MTCIARPAHACGTAGAEPIYGVWRLGNRMPAATKNAASQRPHTGADPTPNQADDRKAARRVVNQ
jgi:hypothetical protein